MAVVNPPGYLNNVATTSGQIDRITAIGARGRQAGGTTATWWDDGVRGLNDCKVTAGAGMSVSVAAGIVFVKGTQSTFQSLYVVMNDGAFTLNIQAANASLARWDLIIARVQDSQYTTGAPNIATLEVVTGTASASPADPPIPVNSFVLARVVVSAGLTNVVTGNIVDQRTYTSSLGGILPVTNQAQRDTLAKVDGQFVYRLDTSNLEYWNANDGIWEGELAQGSSGITAAAGWTVSSQSWCTKHGMGQFYAVFARTGATIAGTASGNLANVPVGTLPTTLRPMTGLPGTSGSTGQLCGYQIQADGTIMLCSTTPNVAIANGASISCGGSFIM